MIGLSMLLVVLGLRTPWRTTAVAWGASTVLTLVLVAATPSRWDQPDVWVSTLVVSAGSGLLIGAAAVLLGQRRAVGAELVAARQDAEQQAGARRAVEERARIARELHDVVAHSMSVVHMQAESAPYRVTDLPPAAREEFATIAATSRTALREMRQLLGTLRGDADAERAPQPGLTDLPALVGSTRAAGLAVTLGVRDDAATDDSAVDDAAVDVRAVGSVTQLTVYRVVQEALGNVVRHAPRCRHLRHRPGVRRRRRGGRDERPGPPSLPPPPGRRRRVRPRRHALPRRRARRDARRRPHRRRWLPCRRDPAPPPGRRPPR
ncbi:sensor histidine kinase [Curtobacterium sp. MCPF17_052]|uniref:sensor histidine kinase n=1 Tax=Curtobacterium sp. MCPF17_052 TaxID=2175655 RepID=UPI00346424D5